MLAKPTGEEHPTPDSVPLRKSSIIQGELLTTTQILENPMSTYRNKCGVSRYLEGKSSRRLDLVRTRLTEASSIVCYDLCDADMA